MSTAGNPPGPLSFAGQSPVPPPGMTLGQVLERVFGLLRANLRLFVSLASVPGLAILAIMALAGVLVVVAVAPHLHDTSRLPNTSQFAWIAIPVFFSYLAIFPVFAFYAAASSFAVVQTNLGCAVTWSQAWGAAWDRRGRHLWLMFLVALIAGGPVYAASGVLLVMSPLLGLTSSSGAASPAFFLVLPFFVLLIFGLQIYALFAFLYLCLAFPASVMENLPAAVALRRSVALTRGARGRIFVVLLVIYAASYVVTLACMLVFFLVLAVAALFGSVLRLTLHSPAFLFFVFPLGLIGLAAIFLVMTALPYAGYSTALGVIYCDQRARQDGALNALPAAGLPDEG
jgi:hypothetical protein